MLLYTIMILFLTNIVDMRMQPVTCNDDIHCSVGFFCHTVTHSCRECFSCDNLRRWPGPKENDCIKSDQQCGPCLQGLIDDEPNWGAMCLSPEVKNMKILLNSYMYILVSCVATGVLISLLIIHGIWNTHIIKVNIACKTSQTTTDPDGIFIKKKQIAFTA